MASVKVSRKYQITIPKDVRKYAKIKPGDKVGVMFYDGVIVVVKVRPMREMRGFLKGIDTNVEREEEDRV
jgi:AbrB family looped-hinge helix DNA binding protein